MNRCIKCGRNIKNPETTSGIEFCKYCAKYEQQLAEKDKEIETLRFTQEQMIKSNKNIHKVCEVFDKQNRYLICKEIREWCEENEFEVENADQSSDGAVYTYKQLFKKLDQIERGE